MWTLDEQPGQVAGLLSSVEPMHVAPRARQRALASVAPSTAVLNAIAIVQQMERQAEERVTAVRAATAEKARDRARVLGRRRTLRGLLDGETTGMAVWLHDRLLPMTAGELHAATPEALVMRQWPDLPGRPDSVAAAGRAIAVFRLLAYLAAAADHEFPSEVAEQLLALVELLGEADGPASDAAPARRRARPPGHLVSASPHVTRGPGRRRPRSLSRGSRRAVRATRGAVKA